MLKKAKPVDGWQLQVEKMGCGDVVIENVCLDGTAKNMSVYVLDCELDWLIEQLKEAKKGSEK